MTDAPLIAILDDEPEIRRLLSQALEQAGFRTQSFSRATSHSHSSDSISDLMAA